MRAELLPFSVKQPSCRQSHSAVWNPRPFVPAAHLVANGGPVKKIFLGIAFICSLVFLNSATAQTFEINGQSSGQQQKSAQKKSKKGGASAPARTGRQSPGPTVEGIGSLGGGLESVRYSRAAEAALKHGDYAGAMNYAQKLTQTSPRDARGWFLLGYTARLAGRSQTSLDAYKRGLQLQPSSVEGLSGEAQTYMRMGKADEAKRILLEVIAANPRRATDLALAGELFMQSGDLPRATGLLERSESVQANPHTETMLAIAYMKQKEPVKAKQLLDKALARNPKNTDILRAVAQFYRAAHDYKSAIAPLTRAPKQTPEVLTELGYTYELAGMKTDSAQTYEKAAEMLPKVITVQLAAAQAEMRVGNLDKARTFLARGEQLDANHYRLHSIRGDLARLGRCCGRPGEKLKPSRCMRH